MDRRFWIWMAIDKDPTCPETFNDPLLTVVVTADCDADR